MHRIVVSVAGVLVMAVAVAGEPAGVSPQDEQYVEAMWQAYFFRAEKTLPALDVELLRRVASAPKSGLLQTKAWTVLGQAGRPDQLAFFVELAKTRNGTELWGNLSMEIVRLVETPADEKVIRPLLDNEKLFPALMKALVRTNDDELLKRIFAEKNAETDALGGRVMNFAQERRRLGFPIDPLMAEPFCKAWVARIYKMRANFPREALLTADLGYAWSARLLMDVIKSRPSPQPVAPGREMTPQDIEHAQKAHRETLALALVALQKLVKQDFGADAAKKPEEFVEAAAVKAKAWWSENSKDPRYNTLPEIPSMPELAPGTGR
ncbi:MAG TPA: hypothetical protein PK280_07180 [Planctomycetota bacterium]|nr:hypothetical protein [Planctomycetota bacterium]